MKPEKHTSQCWKLQHRKTKNRLQVMIQNKSWVRRALGLCKLARQRHRSVQAASQTAGGPTQTPSHDTAEQIGYRGKPIMCTCDSWSLAARLLSLWASWCANRRMVRALCGCGRPPAFPRRLLERLLRAWAWVSLSFLWILLTVSLSSHRKSLPAGPLSTENPAPPFTRKLTSSSWRSLRRGEIRGFKRGRC